MKLNKFNKKLKEEFNDTLNPIELKDDKVKKRIFILKPRFIILSIMSILLLALIIDHISVSSYNLEIEKKYEEDMKNRKELNYDTIEPSTNKYKSELDLKTALNYTENVTRGNKKISILQLIFDILPKGCSSESINYESQPSGGDVPTDSKDTSSPETGNKSSYDTNVVEENIDEADSAKCDGKYIYSLNKSYFRIYDLEGNEIVKEENNKVYVKMYIYNDKIVLSSLYYNIDIYSFDGQSINLEKEFNLSIVESRLYNGNLYIIGSENFTKNDMDTKVNYDNCYYDGCINPDSVVSLYKINLDSLDVKDAQLITSYGNILYMSENYIYFTSHNYSYYGHDLYYRCEFTLFFVFDLNLEGYTAFKEKGYANDKYSFSEYEDNFRFVLTDRTENVYNSVYVYDLKNKKYAGSLLNQIGLPYETVKSVRFSENYVYVCTYRNTDPLYKIDLSDPKNIKILSELHVDGYSGYLHKFIINGESYVLGVGYNNAFSSKISIYKDGEELSQIGNSLVLVSKYYMKYYVPFVGEEAYEIEGDMEVLVENAIGYFFYNDGEKLYFGSQVTNYEYILFEIDVTNEDSPIFVKEVNLENNISDCYTSFRTDVYTFLRCFLINSKLYFVGGEKLVIKDF